MKLSDTSWDMAMTLNNGHVKLQLPTPVSRALIEAGLNRCILTITKSGFTLQPYTGQRPDREGGELVELPFASSG